MDFFDRRGGGAIISIKYKKSTFNGCKWDRTWKLTDKNTYRHSNLCGGGRVWEGRCNKEEEKITLPLYPVQHIHKFIYIIVNYTLNKLRIFLQLRFYFFIVFRSCTPPFKFLLYPMILLFVKRNICEIKFLTEIFIRMWHELYKCRRE